MALCEQKEHYWLVSHDEKLHKMMEVAAVKAGQKVSSMKMAQGILATNALLKTQGRTTLALSEVLVLPQSSGNTKPPCGSLPRAQSPSGAQ